MQEYKNVKVLYIDDFYKTDSENKPTQADKNIAFELLNFRYNNPDSITIISSELQIRDLLAIDEAVGSRIYERSKDYQINIAPDINKNYRLR
jgi:DNA replication protein DnaC